MSYLQFLLTALLGAAPILAQTSVDQVLEKYSQAIGGPEAHQKATTRMMKGSVVIPDDNVTGTALAIAKAPASYRLTLDIPGYGLAETVIDGESGWEKNPDSGVHAMSRTDLANAKRDHMFYRDLKLKELYPKMEMADAAQVNGHKTNVIAATPEGGGPAEKLYFDAETGLLVKHDFERITLEDGIVQYEVLYSDYRDVDGLKLPATIEQRSPDSVMILKFAEIKNNAPVEATAFAKPEK